MSTGYRVEIAGTQFTVIDPWGEHVDVYPTEDAARQDIERCKNEDAMWETANLPVDAAIKAHMQIHDVDRETPSTGFAARQKQWLEELPSGSTCGLQGKRNPLVR